MTDAFLPPRSAPPAGALLTMEDLAERWRVSLDRASRRVKGAAGLRAVNLGTARNPVLRFRIESVAAWESQVEQPAPAFLGGETPAETPAEKMTKPRGPKFTGADLLADL